MNLIELEKHMSKIKYYALLMANEVVNGEKTTVWTDYRNRAEGYIECISVVFDNEIGKQLEKYMWDSYKHIMEDK